MKLYQWVMPILGLLLIPMSASAKTEETSSLSEIVGKASGMQTKITEDGVVTSVSVEDEPGIMQTSLCDAVMGRLQDTSWWKPI